MIAQKHNLFFLQVDVWSAGVMLYQMLFGKRPFGEGCSQEKILRDEVMLNAKIVYFPAKPALSAEGKEFISRCGFGCLSSAVQLISVMVGLLYVAHPAGCQHKSFIPAEAKVPPREGALALVICCAVHLVVCPTHHCHLQTPCHNETV